MTKRSLLVMSLVGCLVGCFTPDLESELASAQRSFAAEDSRTAVIHLQNVLQIAPTNFPARLLAGRIALYVGDFAQARGHLELARDHGAPLAQYPREAWLDVRASSVRQLMGGRLTLAVQKGFDGVLLASLDGYLAETQHGLTADEQLDYNVWLAGEARVRGLAA